MLVISRYQNQELLFPELDLKIIFLKLSQARVCVGIEAPPDIRVLRGELAESALFIGSDAASCRTREWGSFDEARLQKHLYSAREAVESILDQCPPDLQNKIEAFVDNALKELQLIEHDASRSTEPETFLAPSHRPIVLLVDDQTLKTQRLASCLRMRDYDIVLADDGHDAMAYVKTNALPDIVLMDLDAFDYATAAWTINKSLSSGIKLIGFGDTRPEQLGFDFSTEQLDGWFDKPIAPEKIVSSIDRIVCTM